jgi:hypothetical protein
MGLTFKPKRLQAASQPKPDGRAKNGGYQPRDPKDNPTGPKARRDRRVRPGAYRLKVRHRSAEHPMSRDVLKSVLAPLVLSIGLSILAILMAVLVFMQFT